jgi:hypothetical protein
MIRAFVAAGAMLVAAAVVPASADDAAKPLKGSYTMLPGDAEGGVPTMYITITGPAAESLYKGLSAKEENDQCNGGKTKWLDGGFCNLADDKKYSCSFGIDLKAAKFYWGEDC